jgi:hypothetical protein
LGTERIASLVAKHGQQILCGLFIGDLAVGLSSDERQIRNVISFSGEAVASKERLGEEVVKLQSIASASVMK